MNIDQYFQSHIWEELGNPKEFVGNVTCVDIHAIFGIEHNIRLLNAYRDDNYDIRIKAEGELLRSAVDYRNIEKTMGISMSGGTMVCDMGSKGVITLRNCISEPPTLNYKPNSDVVVEFSMPFGVEDINWKRCIEGAEMDTMVEWYLNGVQDSSLFCESSFMKDEVSRVITRAGNKVHEMHNIREYSSSDCLYISFNDTGVLMRKVFQKYGPSWNSSLALEYRSEYGRIPDKEERQKISEFLGFLLGRHLILVGDTAYYNDAVIESNMYNPHSQNTVAECNSITKEIVSVHHCKKDSKSFREYAEVLLPNYLKIRDTYEMDSVLARYWLANIMPAGVNLPVLAGALESVMKTWFRGENSKTKGVYIDAKSYESIVKDFIVQIEESLVECEYRDKILNKISNAYQIGVNDRYFIFLRELGLEYGDAEKSCIRARNAFTHGDKKVDDFETLQKTRTMFILFGRVILKLLEYDGQYIDETIKGEGNHGFASKGINDSIG